MKMIFLFLIAIFPVLLQAQPVFSAAEFQPQAGDQYVDNTAQIQNIGQPGANQTWNFSTAILNGTANFSVMAIGTIPCGSNFPNGNIGIGTGGCGIFSISSTDYMQYGNCSTPGMPQYIYSDPEKQFVFPMNYTNNFSDLFAGMDPNLSDTNYIWGGDTVTYDGYGTLITPSTTYNNVIRIHRQISYTDSSSSPFSASNEYCSGDYYYWFAIGYRYPVAEAWTIPCVNGGFSSGAYILQSITIGEKELTEKVSALETFPNPFTSSITIKSAEAESGDKIFIRDLSGRIVRTEIFTGTEMTISLAELESGVYFISVNESAAKRMVKLNP